MDAPLTRFLDGCEDTYIISDEYIPLVWKDEKIQKGDLSVYEELAKIIAENNEKYTKLNEHVYSIRSHETKESLAVLEKAKFDRWQFTHDYAKLLSDFLWSKKQELTPKDLSALDMVPYDVWRRMSEKSNIVVQVIMDIYKEGKEND